jgi:hypothetical protein
MGANSIIKAEKVPGITEPKAHGLRRMRKEL